MADRVRSEVRAGDGPLETIGRINDVLYGVFGFRGNTTVETAFNGIFKDADAFNKQFKLFFISIGTEERFGTKEATEQLIKHGIKNIVYFESQGTAHEWLTWRRSLNEFAPRLFK